jgi:hypothetical protein
VRVSLGAQSVVVQSLSIFGLTCVELSDRHFHINILQQFYYSTTFSVTKHSCTTVYEDATGPGGGGSPDNRHSVEGIPRDEIAPTNVSFLPSPHASFQCSLAFNKPCRRSGRQHTRHISAINNAVLGQWHQLLLYKQH